MAADAAHGRRRHRARLASRSVVDRIATSTMDVAGEAAAGAAGRTWSLSPTSRPRARPAGRAGVAAGRGAVSSSSCRPASTPRCGALLAAVTLAAGVAVREGIERARPDCAPELKWPNDVMVGRRKLAGILAEGVAIGTATRPSSSASGINVQPAAYPPEIAARATSLEAELGRAVDRDACSTNC